MRLIDHFQVDHHGMNKSIRAVFKVQPQDVPGLLVRKGWDDNVTLISASYQETSIALTAIVIFCQLKVIREFKKINDYQNSWGEKPYYVEECQKPKVNCERTRVGIL